MRVDFALLLHATAEHIELTAIAVGIAVVIGVPLGAYLNRERFLAGPVLALVGVIQTVPSLALLGLLIPLLGIGEKPALLALFLYALLPIVRNTHDGLGSIDPSALEAARGMGMRPSQVLLRIALPLALPVVMGGIRTSTVINVGVATLAALIGAGGLGQFIFRGIAMVDMPTVLMGAIPSALLALVLDGLLAWAERRMIPAGLRAEN
ncbi:MAG TPA: ABC transporter permease [Polyangiaceae bacterium]|jgi:osmoprotectant transport system permease protein